MLIEPPQEPFKRPTSPRIEYSVLATPTLGNPMSSMTGTTRTPKLDNKTLSNQLFLPVHKSTVLTEKFWVVSLKAQTLYLVKMM